jgi:isocitrate/isopropylmalate dehydrogenase
MAGNKHTEEINALLERISLHRARAAKIKEAVDRDIEALKEKYTGDLTSETSHAEAAEKPVEQRQADRHRHGAQGKGGLQL